ncbi:UNVERIFIED_CONTAM: hypothetical protein PYX00_000136 [Menopon gallinae]|uniref:MARVEL domain-containing protein n=1 Tax=Menopon gallinae TaxID=328185 RepID=A0AAW2I7W9_9NEOP
MSREMSCCKDVQIFFVNIAELILIIIIAGLIADAVCFDCYYHLYKNQFINGVVYGFLIIACFVVLEFYIPDRYSCLWHFIVALMGAILFFVVAILVLDYLSRYPNYADSSIFIRLIFAGVFCLILSALFVFNTMLFSTREECCEPIENARCW